MHRQADSNPAYVRRMTFDEDMPLQNENTPLILTNGHI